MLIGTRLGSIVAVIGTVISALRILSPLEASDAFNAEIERSREVQSDTNGTFDAAAMNRTSDGSRVKPEDLVTSLRPIVSAFLCTQLDIDLSYLVPGLWVNVGVLGGIRIDPNSRCWSTTFEVSVGFEWGVKVLDYFIGIGFMGIGSLDISEVPVAKATSGLDAEQIHQLYLPEGADPNRCHTGNPFSLVQTYIEHQYRRIFQSSQVSLPPKDMAQVRSKEAELRELYSKLHNSTFQTYAVMHDVFRTITPPPVEDWILDVEDGGGEPPLTSLETYTAVNAPDLLLPAVAMVAMARCFAGTLPAYATQVIERLVDNGEDYIGTDNERKNSNSHKRMVRSSGRFLARWPDERSLDAFEVAHVSGVSKRGDGADQRVINFAKVARLSENNQDPNFWKEFAMSAGNLLVRTLADVHALFATFFANDPKWDGYCDSLVSSFDTSSSSLMGNKFRKKFESYPWASESTRDNKRLTFTLPDEILQRHGPKALNGLPGISNLRKWTILPHLWCVLGEDAPEHVQQDDELSEFRRATQPFELSLVQTCHSVIHETRELLLDDVILWNEEEGRYDVVNRVTKDFVGFLYSKGGDFYGNVCMTCLHSLSEDDRHREAVQKQFVVANRKMEARLECEKARFSTAFTKIFPRFAYISKQFMLRMETVLLGINVCLDQVHNGDFLAESFHHLKKSYSGIKDYCNADTPRYQKLEYVSMLGKHAVSLVRMLLIRLGAHTSLVSQPSDRIPLSEGERSLAARGKLFAPTAYYMAADFFEAFGVGPQHQANHSHNNIDVDNIAQYELQGRVWPHFPRAIPRIFETIDVTNRIKNGFESRLRPPLVFTQSFAFSAQFARTEFCTEGGMPNAGVLVFRATRKVTRRTWSATERSPQTCLWARIRPGDFYVQVTQCYGSEPVGHGTDKRFSDWSVKVASFALKLFSGLPAGGVLGNILNSNTGPLQASLLSGAQLGGDALSLFLAKKIGPYVQESKILKGLLSMGVVSSPLLSVLGAVGSVTSEAGFLGIVRRFLGHLSRHGDVMATESWPTPVPPFYTLDSGVSSILALITEGGHKRWDDGSYEERSSMHVESWNRAVFGGLALPTPVRVQVYGRLDIDWDLSSWFWLQSQQPPTQNGSDASESEYAAANVIE